MARFAHALLFSGSLLCATPLLAAEPQVQVQLLQDKLQHPWSVAFLPDNQTLLITERSGQLRSWTPQGGLSQPISGGRRSGHSARAACWTWYWHPISPAADASG